MKNVTLSILTLIFVTFYACQSPADTSDKGVEAAVEFDEAKEKAAILSAIEQETKCFFERDYECWKEYWIQEDYAFQAWNNADGTFDAAVGWDKIHDQGKSYIDNVPEGKTKTSHPIVKRGDIQFKFYGDNLAYLIWQQYNSDRKNEYYSVSQETRLMEKQDGKWKIVNVTAFWDMVNKIPFAELAE